MAKTSLVATLHDSPHLRGEALQNLSTGVDWLEVRADQVREPSIEWLRSRFGGSLIFTLRSRAEGGNAECSAAERCDRLLNAARDYDLIDLEADRDLSPELLSAIPPHKRLISWHGEPTDLRDLSSRLEKLSRVEARFYKLTTSARGPRDALTPLLLLKALTRSDVIAYATGQVGLWSRLVSPSLGSSLIFGSVEPAEGEPSVKQLIQDYGFPAMTPINRIYGIAGNPVSHSLSPRLHNAAYRASGRHALFVPFHVDSFSDFWSAMVEDTALKLLDITLAGLTVASPHKEAALAVADKISAIASRAGSVNLLVRDNGHWKADTTDPDIAFAAGAEFGVEMERRRAAVIGCGGAGRAIAAALIESNAIVTLVNRGAERGEHASRLLSLPYIPLKDFDATGYDIVVNATPVGRNDGQTPIKIEQLDQEATVIDLVYGVKPTPLVAGAGGNGRVIIDGRDVLLTQVRRQFQIMTGQKMSVTLARASLDRQETELTLSLAKPADTGQGAAAPEMIAS